jgi:hypothetical protein
MTMPVSGPGPYSQRTDKQPIREVTGLPYGEGQALTEQQQSAPMAQAPRPAPVPFNAPTTRPDQPVTAGADRGPGPSSAVLGMRPRPAGTPLTEALSKAAANDPSGTLAALLMEAMKRGL